MKIGSQLVPPRRSGCRTAIKDDVDIYFKFCKLDDTRFGRLFVLRADGGKVRQYDYEHQSSRRPKHHLF